MLLLLLLYIDFRWVWWSTHRRYCTASYISHHIVVIDRVAGVSPTILTPSTWSPVYTSSTTASAGTAQRTSPVPPAPKKRLGIYAVRIISYVQRNFVRTTFTAKPHTLLLVCHVQTYTPNAKRGRFVVRGAPSISCLLYSLNTVVQDQYRVQ